MKKNALGRGLGALIDMEDIHTGGGSSINEIALDLIEANPNQPRRHFDQEALEDLAASISQLGVVQPITLREIDNDKYQIIAGERRFRAAKMAGLDKIPAYIKTADDESLMEMALVENIQREDLNAIEIALTYQRLIEDYKFTQEALSAKVGKKRATIANYLRLLKLPAEVQLGIKNKAIDMGHARALASLDDAQTMIKIYEEASQNGYSVRKVEEMVHDAMNGVNPDNNQDPSKAKKSSQKNNDNSDFEPLCNKLSNVLGTKVGINRSANGKGKIVLYFSSDEELENLLATIDRIH